MAYVLVAVGAVMALSGMYLMITGWAIVQIERGWTSVISGSTLVSAGIVTIALGLVLRALRQLVLDRPEAAPALVASAPVFEPAAPPTVVPVAPPAYEQRSEPAVTDPAAAETHAAPPSPLPTFADTSLEPEPAPPPPEPQVSAHPIAAEPASYADEVEPDPAADREVVEAAPVPALPEPRPPTGGEEPEIVQHTLDEISPPELREPIHPEPTTHLEPTPARPEPSASKEEPASPPMDDWLDRAFAEIDREGEPPPLAASQEPVKAPAPPSRPPLPKLPKVAQRPPRPQVRPARLPREPAMAEIDSSSQAVAETPPEPAPAVSAEAAGLPPKPDSAVVGRYEADGTMYVMYADGSIEAQVEGGVYRFASMAELKAFIES